MDVVDVTATDAKSLADSFDRHLPLQCEDFPGGGLCDLGCAASLAARVSAVGQLVGFVLGPGFPIEVPLGYASQMPATAGMGGLMLGCWGWAMHFLAKATMDKLLFSIKNLLGVAGPIPAVRPDQALIVRAALVGEQDFTVEAIDFPLRRPV